MGESHRPATSLSQPATDAQSFPSLSQYAEAVLASRATYRACHIEIPGQPFAVAAIAVEGYLYSLFKVTQTQSSAAEILKRLHSRGDRMVVTIIPKGYAIWIFEPKASVCQRQHLLDVSSSQRRSTPAAEGHVTKEKTQIPYQILTSKQQYHSGKAIIRGLECPVPVIYFQQKCYSLFKTIHDIKHAARIVKQVAALGKQVVVTRKDNGYGIWVLEHDADVVE